MYSNVCIFLFSNDIAVMPIIIYLQLHSQWYFYTPPRNESNSLSLAVSGTPPQTGTGILIVSLSDVNDNFPEFAQDYRPVVYENQPPGLTVVHVSAVDRDIMSNGPSFEFWLPCGGACPCPSNPVCNDFAFKFLPGIGWLERRLGLSDENLTLLFVSTERKIVYYFISNTTGITNNIQENITTIEH